MVSEPEIEVELDSTPITAEEIEQQFTADVGSPQFADEVVQTADKLVWILDYDFCIEEWKLEACFREFCYEFLIEVAESSTDEKVLEKSLVVAYKEIQRKQGVSEDLAQIAYRQLCSIIDVESD